MKKRPEAMTGTGELRRRAEAHAAAQPQDNASGSDAHKLLHELQVHQIELEMQNEELRQARTETENLLERYTELYDYAPVGYFALCCDSKIRKVNLAGAGLLGIPRGMLENYRFTDFVEPADRALFQACIDRVSAGNGSESCELALAHGGDTPRFVHVDAVADASGQVCRVTLVDITECKQTELLLRNSEQRYRTLAAATFEGIAVTSMGKFVDVNDQLLAMLGYERREIVGRDVIDLITPEDRERVVAIIKQDMECLIEHQFVHKDGTRIIVEAHVQTLVQQNVPVRYAAIRDITGRKHDEKSLRMYAERLQSHMENSPMAFVAWDNEYKVTQWSGAAEKLFGWSAQETLGTPLMDLHMIYEQDIPLVQQTMAKLADGKSRYAFSANRNVTKDGRVIHCEWYNSMLSDESGRMSSIMSQVLDVTERKRFEQDLLAANDRLTDEVRLRTADLSALAAHIQSVAETERANLARELHDELGSILVGISMELGQLKEKVTDPDALDNVIQLKELLTQAIQTKRGVVNHLYPTVLENCGLIAAINSQVREFRKRSGAVIDLLVPDAESFEMEHALSLTAYRIVQECLTNIAKHAKADRIQIEVKHSDDKLDLTIRDNGKGLPGNVKTGGHGIFGMIERARHLGGSLTFMSEPGEGTTVNLLLPIKAAKPLGKKLRVLVVDDHAIVRDAIRQLLESQASEFSVEGEAADGKTGAQMAIAGKWDIVLLDTSLPKMNGIKVLEEIVAAKPYLPVIMLSSHTREEYGDIALAKGAVCYVEKGETDRLVDVMRQFALKRDAG